MRGMLESAWPSQGPRATAGVLRGGELNMRSIAEIQAEIIALGPGSEDYDTECQTDRTSISVGAHDALLWALGLAEAPVSELLKQEGE